MGLNNGTFGEWSGQTYNLGVTSGTVIKGASSAPVAGTGIPTYVYLDVNSDVIITLFYVLYNQFLGGNVSIFGTALPNNGNLFQYGPNNTVGSMIINSVTDMSNPVVYEPIQLLFNQYLTDQFNYTVVDGFWQSTGTVLIGVNTAPTAIPQTALVLNGQSAIIGLVCIDNEGTPTYATITSLPSLGALYQIEVNEQITRTFSVPIINANTTVTHPSKLVGYLPITQLGGFTTTFNYTCQHVNSSLVSNQTTVTLSVSVPKAPPLVGGGMWALQFNGANNFAITISNNTQISGIGTIEMWIKVTQCQSQQQILVHGVYDVQNPAIGFLFSLVCDNNSNFYLLVQNVGNISGNSWVLFSVNQSIPLVLNMWTYVGVTFLSPTVTFFVNGARIGSGNIGTIASPSALCLGAQYPLLANFQTTPIPYPPTTDFFAGEMDEVRIWSIARDVYQIAQTFSTKVSPTSPGLEAYWDFNQGFGTVVVDLVHPPPPFNKIYYDLYYNDPAFQILPEYYYYSSQNYTNALWLGAGINAFQPIFVVSDGPQFNSFVTFQNFPLQIQLYGSSLVSDLLTFVITQLPTFGTLYQVSNGQMNPNGQIYQPFLSWDTRYPQEQWPFRVVAFSSYLNLTTNSSAYLPQNILGPPPNYLQQNFIYGDDTNSWAPQWPCTNYSETDFIIVQYSIPVYIFGVEIYENYNPGAVTKISSFDYVTNLWLPLYTGTPTIINPPQYTIFSPRICEANFLTDLLRVELSVCAFPGPPEISGIKIIGTTQARSGAVLDRNGTIVYVPNPNFRSPPTDFFTYSAFDCPYDQSRQSLSLIQNISVTPTNSPPVSMPLNVSLMENQYLIITLLGTDVDGDSLTFIIQTLPLHGTLYQVSADGSRGSSFTNPGIVSNPNGTVLYQPDSNECGLQLDSFFYAVSDRVLMSNNSLVTINVYCIPGTHTIPESLVYVFWALAIGLLASCVLLFAAVIRYRNTSEFRNSSPLLSCIMIVGALVAITSIFFFGGPLTVFDCHFRVWLILIGYDLFLGSLFAQAFRIWRILAHRTLKRRGKLSEPYLLIIVGIVVALDIVGLSLYSFYGGSVVQDEVDKDNPAVTDQVCTYNPIILYILIAYKGLILLFCVSLCFLIGSVSTTLPNFRSIAISVFTLTLSTILIVPVFFLTDVLSPTALFLTAALFTTLPLAISLVVLFVPKIRRLTRRRHVENDIDFTLSPPTTTTAAAKTMSTVASTFRSSNENLKKVSRRNNKEENAAESNEDEDGNNFKEYSENKTVVELMEVLRKRDNEIEILQKKLREKKEKIHKLRRQLAELKEQIGFTVNSPTSNEVNRDSLSQSPDTK
jgi:hypothetical protein